MISNKILYQCNNIYVLIIKTFINFFLHRIKPIYLVLFNLTIFNNTSILFLILDAVVSIFHMKLFHFGTQKNIGSLNIFMDTFASSKS